MVVVCACVAGGCRGPLFVLGPFVLAGDGLRGGALFGCFSRGFFICGKDHGLCSFFLLASSVRERERFIFWITARPHAIGVVCGGCLSVFVRFLGLSLFCDSSDLKGF